MANSFRFGHEDLQRPKEYNGHLVHYVQPKLNGIRILVIKRESGHPKIITRDNKSDHWEPLCRISHVLRLAQALPPCSAIDCELWAEGYHETSVISLIKASSDELRLSAFAAPFWDGRDFRKESLPHALRVLEHNGWDVVPTHKVGDEPRVLTAEEVEEYKQKALEAGTEGYVAKLHHYSNWYKIKRSRTADLLVLGYSISDSYTHYGKLKAIKVGYPGEELASVGSGFDQEWRHTVDPKTLVGRVAEIQYDEVAANGRLKFPRFIRWRDDKTPDMLTPKEEL